MSFYIIHELPIRNAKEMTQAENQEVGRLFKTEKVPLFHRIAESYREEFNLSVQIGNTVVDTSRNPGKVYIGFEINATDEQERKIIDGLAWVDQCILEIVSTVRGVFFEPSLSSIKRPRTDDFDLEKPEKDLLSTAVHKFIESKLIANTQLKLTDFKGQGKTEALTVHRAEIDGEGQDTTTIYTMIGKVIDYDSNQRLIKVEPTGQHSNIDPESQPQTPKNFEKVSGTTETEQRKKSKSQRPPAETFYIEPSEFADRNHQSKYTPWARHLEQEIQFKYQVLDGKRYVCLRMDAEYSNKREIQD